jgi:hypothetical protein
VLSEQQQLAAISLNGCEKLVYDNVTLASISRSGYETVDFIINTDKAA